MFLNFFGFAVIKACAWVDSLCRVGFWLNGDHGAGINEDTDGTKLNYTICFGLAGEIVSGIFVYRETMCTE